MGFFNIEDTLLRCVKRAGIQEEVTILDGFTKLRIRKEYRSHHKDEDVMLLQELKAMLDVNILYLIPVIGMETHKLYYFSLQHLLMLGNN